MVEGRAVQIGALLWALAGWGVAVASLSAVNADARVLVGIASVVFPACAAVAAVAVGHDHLRTAGLLLLLSVATPTYFAWVLNVPALIVGIALVAAPRLLLRRPAASAVSG